jgi:glutathione peroxidase
MMKPKGVMMRVILVSFMLLVANLYGEKAMNIYDFSVKSIDGKEVSLSHYQGRVMLIVNVASECGFTSQYEGLQRLHEKYHHEGLSILGFPCNQFLGQEPANEEQIKAFCMTRFGVKFDMFSKIDVNGDDTHPLYAYLKSQAKGILGSEKIKWNFTKFLVDKEGKVLKRYAPSTKPKEIEEDIVGVLR